MTTATTASVRARTVRRRPAWLLPLLGPATVLAILVLWELLSRTGVLPAQAFPSASSVLASFVRSLGDGAFWAALWATVYSSAIGLVILTAIASALALLVTSSRFLWNSTWFLIEFLKPIPPVALIPLGLLLWGPSPMMKIILVVFGAV